MMTLIEIIGGALRHTAFVAVLVLPFLLVSCKDVEDAYVQRTLTMVELDGVRCVVTSRGGIDCDWENAP